jgi:truncated hemoglobin YjbI
MSKQELFAAATKLSGITHSQSLLASTALSPPLLSIIGGPTGFHTLSTLFYNRVFNDTSNPWFLGIFATSTKEEAVDNQYRFLVQSFGGEELYTAKKGGKYGVRLVGRHANYTIGSKAAERWIEHMECAIDEHDALRGEENEVARKYLKMYFRFTAYYIVVAKEYMREDQLSGGNQMDGGRVW